MQQTKRKFKLDFSAATILALVALLLFWLNRMVSQIFYGDAIVFTVWTYLYDMTVILWFAACLFRNNKIAFGIMAVSAFAARILYYALLVAVFPLWSIGSLIIGACIEIVCCIMLILCVLRVIKGAVIPTIFGIGMFVGCLADFIQGRDLRYIFDNGMLAVLNILGLILYVVLSASIVMLFLSRNNRQRTEQRQKQELNRQQIEQQLWRLKQHYDAKQISEQQYAYWKEELLKKL